MSIVHSPMYNNDHFKPGHGRSRSYNEILSQFKTAISSSPQVVTTSPQRATYIKKRSYSDLIKESPSLDGSEDNNKRSRTAPPSPPYESTTTYPNYKKSVLNLKNITIRSRSLSPDKCSFPKTNPISPCDSPVTSPVIKKQEVVEETKILSPMSSVQLPSLTSALQSTPMNSVKLNPITPTVSLDYFDTYKPNDENWRFELMDSITKSSKQYNLDRYNYLNRQESHPSLSRYSSSYKISKPSFNSKISPKILHPQQFPSQSYQQQLQLQYQYLSHPRKSYSEKKIKFPYESNYTYLNKTYLTDVAKYPEYLELAESLILLSQLDQSLYVYSPTQEAKPQPILQTIHTSPVLSASTTAPKFHLPQISSIITSPTSIASSHQTAVSPILSALAAPNQHQHQHPTPNPNNHHNHHNHQQQHQQHYQPHYHQTQAYNPYLSYEVPSTPQVQHKSIPLTPPSTKSKSRSEMIKSPPKSSQNSTRVCISCGSDQSPCWRPSWSIKEGQLCNSCGLRYKKTAARCLNKECKKIPAKGEWSLMQSKGKSTFDDGNEGYGCLDCGHRVEVKK